MCTGKKMSIGHKRCLVARRELRRASNKATLRAFRNADRFTTFKIFRRPGRSTTFLVSFIFDASLPPEMVVAHCHPDVVPDPLLRRFPYRYRDDARPRHFRISLTAADRLAWVLRATRVIAIRKPANRTHGRENAGLVEVGIDQRRFGEN